MNEIRKRKIRIEERDEMLESQLRLSTIEEEADEELMQDTDSNIVSIDKSGPELLPDTELLTDIDSAAIERKENARHTIDLLASLKNHNNNVGNVYNKIKAIGHKTKESQKNLERIEVNTILGYNNEGEFTMTADRSGAMKAVRMSRVGIQNMANGYFNRKGIKCNQYIMIDECEHYGDLMAEMMSSLRYGESKIVIVSSNLHSIPMVIQRRKASKIRNAGSVENTDNAIESSPEFLCILADRDAPQLQDIGHDFIVMQPKEAIRERDSYNHGAALPLASSLFQGIVSGDINPEKLFKESSKVRVAGKKDDINSKTKVINEYHTPNRMKAVSENVDVQKKAKGIRNLIRIKRNRIEVVSNDGGKTKYNASLDNRVSDIVSKHVNEELNARSKENKENKSKYAEKSGLDYRSGSYYWKEAKRRSVPEMNYSLA